LPVFFSLGYELPAYTRAELIQDRLSKIGIKQSVIDETIKFEYDIKDEKNLSPGYEVEYLAYNKV